MDHSDPRATQLTDAAFEQDTADRVRGVLNATVRPLPLEALPRDGRAPLDPEAGRVAVAEFRAAVQGGEVEVAVLLACLAYQRHQDARRAHHCYTTSNGLRLQRQHADAVHTALATLTYYGGDEGPNAEDAMARALAAADAWWEKHLAEERAHEARHAAHARQIAADLAQARRRTAVCVTISRSQR